MHIRKTVLSDGSIRYSASFAIQFPALMPPTPPAAVPDGNHASEAEMIAAMHKYRVYNSDVEGYLRRLQFEEKCGHISRFGRDRLHNAAVDTLRMVVGRFNLQVRKFKGRQSLRLAPFSETLH